MPQKTQIHSFEKSEFYQHWMNRVKGRKEELSAGMKTSYKSAMKQFFIFHNSNIEGIELTLDDIFYQAKTILEENPREGPDKILDLLFKFENWLQGKEVEGYYKRELGTREKFLQPVSAHQKAHAIVRGFYTHNMLWLPEYKGEEFESLTRNNDVNHAVFKNSEDGLVADWDEFRFWMSKLNFRDQTIALCLLSTSQDIGDLLKLKIEFVNKQQKRKRLYWPGKRAKTGVIFKTFFSQEATNWLKRYIEVERPKTDPGEPIFININKNSTTVNNVSENFRLAAEKIGITWDDDVQCPFRPKRMRGTFNTACYTADIDDDLKHIFMGHKRNVNSKYRNVTPEILEQQYLKVEPLLTVYGDTSAEEVRIESRSALSKALEVEQENLMLKQELESLNVSFEQIREHQTNIDRLFSGEWAQEQQEAFNAMWDYLQMVPIEQGREQAKIWFKEWPKAWAILQQMKEHQIITNNHKTVQ